MSEESYNVPMDCDYEYSPDGPDGPLVGHETPLTGDSRREPMKKIERGDELF